MPTTGFVGAFDKFIRRAFDAMTNISVKDGLPVMAIALGIITEETTMSGTVETGTLCRIRKVADYHRTCGLMRHAKKKRQGFGIPHVQLQLFPPRAESYISVHGKGVDALDGWTSAFPQPPIPNVAAIKAACKGDAEDLMKGRTGRSAIKCTQHCELSVALHLLQRRLEKNIKSRTSYEIGCSKADCVWRDPYLRTLNFEGPPGATCVCHSLHGKRTEGRLLSEPLPGYEGVNDYVLGDTGAEAEKIFAQVQGRLHRSDSPGMYGEALSGDEALEEMALDEGEGM